MKKLRLILLTLFMFLCVGFGNNIIYASGGAVLEASSTVTEKDKAVVDIDLKGNTGNGMQEFL